jgi:CRP-like cAMP-binding protein
MGLGSTFSTSYTVHNQLLTSLSDEEFSQIRPALTRVRLVPDQVLIERGQATEHVFFLEEGMVSLVAEAGSRRPGVQVAMIGREGMVGGFALLGPEQGSFTCAVTQMPGPAMRMPVAELRRFVEQSPAMRSICSGSVHLLMGQIMQTAACNARNTLAERCVRWLLMAHDRVDGNDLPITHEALSIMLGVRRSGITVVLSGLQDAGLIRANRGRITILNRPGLELAAGDRTGIAEPRNDGRAPVRQSGFPVGSPVAAIPVASIL